MRYPLLIALLLLSFVALADVIETAEQRDVTFEQGIVLFEESKFEEALALIKPLAETGHANAQYQMGLMHTWGVGVAQDETLAQKWYAEAFERMLIAANGGDGDSMADLGLMLDEGQGVDRDVEAALEWLTKGVEVNNASAIAYMGDMYLYGHGVPTSVSEAQNWYRQSAGLGNDYALTMLKRLEQTTKIDGDE